MARTITWSGQTWTVRPKSNRSNPGPNAWGDTSQNVRVDSDGNLILSIVKDGSYWRCADVTSQKAFGYGNYKWVVNSNLTTLDPNAVFGLFTYDVAEVAVPYNEIDIEATRWGDRNEKRNCWVTVQPDLHGDLVLTAKPPYTLQFTWYTDRANFKVQDGTGATLYFDRLYKKLVPNITTKAILDLWLMSGRAPTTGLSQSVSVRSFKHTPPA